MTDPRHMNITTKDAARSAADGATVGLACAAGILLAAMLVAKPAEAVTITPTAAPAHSNPLALDAYTFENTSGVSGSGGSVFGDPSMPVLKFPTSVNNNGIVDADGRGSLDLGSAWYDSNDIPGIRATLLFPGLVDSFALWTRDENDQRNSFWTVTIGGTTYSAPPRVEADPSPLRFLYVMLDGPTDSATLDFATKRNDGWNFGVLTSAPAPIPLPATALLLLGGLAGLAMVRRRC